MRHVVKGPFGHLATLFDYLVGELLEIRGHIKSERFCRLCGSRLILRRYMSHGPFLESWLHFLNTPKRARWGNFESPDINASWLFWCV